MTIVIAPQPNDGNNNDKIRLLETLFSRYVIESNKDEGTTERELLFLWSIPTLGDNLFLLLSPNGI